MSDKDEEKDQGIKVTDRRHFTINGEGKVVENEQDEQQAIDAQGGEGGEGGLPGSLLLGRELPLLR